LAGKNPCPFCGSRDGFHFMYLSQDKFTFSHLEFFASCEDCTNGVTFRKEEFEAYNQLLKENEERVEKGLNIVEGLWN